ncbi:phage tail tube protein [Mesorhizobium sp. DCY119]|uniref:phage tail tube protein n=1 Tax=Mesorhizobium sp. DCY119 TaxID=2108445 RepID=UPI000E6BFEFB|nr:phage tail tube protein [Mesorhizobium sp. DCY119]RJG44917.1 phage tail protein [Mesorhizobium sp. DCY119]
MAQQKGRTLLIQIGDGATPGPEVFSNLCGIKTRSYNLSTTSVDTTIPNCVDPGGPVQRTSEPGISSRAFSGSGAFVSSAVSTAFIEHVNNSEVFNAKVIVPGVGTYTGAWFVTDFEFTGETEGNMEFSASFEAAGVLTFVAES